MKLLEQAIELFRKIFGPHKKSVEPPIQPPPDLPNVSPPVRRIVLVEKLRGQLADECYEIGYETARKGGRRTPDQAVLKAMEALAESKALAKGQPISQAGQDDLLRRLKEWEAMQEQRVLDRDGAANKLNASLHALAVTVDPGAYPELSAMLRICATAWLTMSLSPTMHDLLTGLDPFMKWVLGIATAAGISIAILRGILPIADPKMGAPSNSATRHHGAVIAGILLGIGFLVLRLSGARTYGDMLLASALALMEMGAVVLVERKAKPLFVEIEAWRERLSIRRVAQAIVEADQRELNRRQDLVDEATSKLVEIEDGLECAHAFSDPKQVIAIAVNAMKAGYMRGTSGNAADLGGVA